jgi:hypothetical protein
MDESLDNKLKNKFSFYTIPNEFGEEYKTAFDFGNGWFDLVEQMSEDIRNLIESKYPGSDFIITYMKEKYGTLDIFTYNCPDDIDYIVSQAEHDSEHICEQCGEFGEMKMLGGWMMVRCPKCWAIIQEINKK